MRPGVVACILWAWMLAPAARAQDGPACTPAQLAPVDAWLAKHPWKVGRTIPDARIDAACKASSVGQAVLIVAAAYDQGTDDDRIGVGNRNFMSRWCSRAKASCAAC